MDATIIREFSENNPELVAASEVKLQEILGRSATDADFRRKLVETPREALSEAFGREVPETFNVSFIENRASATIVLPDFVDVDAPLSEEQLEAVAGGSEPVTLSALAITAAVLTAAAIGVALGDAIHKATCDAH